MTPLAHRIRTLISRDGAMPVERFMALCLGDPDHGYYMNRDPFGRAGDFITAPEVSQMFGELIAMWCIDFWRRLSAPEPLRLVELGPGRGTLMTDLVRAAGKVVPAFAAACDIHLVDTSPALREVQQRTLAGVGIAARWHDRLEKCPTGPSIVIANEFFDALPIRQYARTADGWRERGVTVGADNRFCFTTLPGPVDPAAIPGTIAGAATGAIFERSPAAAQVIADLAKRFSADPGIALIIDYGPGRSGHGETLQALSGHRPAGVLERPGAVDLTAHVDFEYLIGLGRQHGLEAHGPVPQGVFLNALGLAARVETLSNGTDGATRRAIASAAERLAGGQQMGQHFKVIMITSHGAPVPEPFASAP